jgi:hypothetical protein
MKKQLSLLILMVFCLSGCSSLLDREYLSVTPYAAPADETGDEAILQAENYADLVSDISYFVSEGSETGTIRLYNYTGDVNTDLNGACLQVTKDTPMGTYAVEYIKPTYSRIVSYYEAVVSITYRRTPEQIAALVTVSGTTAMKEKLQALLQTFPTEVAFQVSYLNQDVTYLQDLVTQAYYDTPAAALGLPSFSVAIYPDAGVGRRIVEITFIWPEDSVVLQQKYTTVKDEVTKLVESAVSTGQSRAELAEALHTALWSTASYDSAGGATAYDALVLHKANSQGMALAYEALCDLAGLNCIPVEGFLYNDPFYWCIVAVDDGYRHVNTSRNAFALMTDSDMVTDGCAWNQENYPVCSNG